MRHLREIFRQKFVLGLAHRAIAQSVGVSLGAVATALSRARNVGLNWEQVEQLGDDALEERLYGGRGGRRTDRAPLPEPAQLHLELRKTGVTLQLLHLEYLENNPNGYRHVESILKHGLDRVGPNESTSPQLPLVHGNVRGRGYYQ
jgi:hypothetical protein